MKKKRIYKPKTEEQKRRHAQTQAALRRKNAEEGRVMFRCALCGGEFQAPNGPPAPNAEKRFRSFVRLGGRIVCEYCARARFKRRRNPWGINPDAIQ